MPEVERTNEGFESRKYRKVSVIPLPILDLPDLESLAAFDHGVTVPLTMNVPAPGCPK